MDLRKEFASSSLFQAYGENDKPSVDADVRRAAFTLARREELLISEFNARRAGNEKRAKIIGELGGDEALARNYSIIDPGITAHLRETMTNGSVQSSSLWRSLGVEQLKAFEEVIKFERNYPGLVLDDKQLFEDFKQESAKLREKEQHTLERGSGLQAFIGTAGAILTDPLILLSLPFGATVGAGRTFLQTVGRTALIEGAIGLGVEIPIQAQVFNFKRAIESPWSFRQSAINVLSAGAGGVLIGGGIAGGIFGARRALSRYKDAKAAGKVDSTPELDEAEQILEDTIGLHDENKLGVDTVDEAGKAERTPADGTHERAFETARIQHSNDQPVDVADIVVGTEPVDGINSAVARMDDPNEIVPLGPDELLVDAKTFQFKSGTDGAGVTDALKGVIKFDRVLAGVSLIWENKAGQRFIVDGHQRHALAKRAIAAGQDPETVKLNAFILREADGVTAIDARRMAASKNIAEGTGSAIDAAKIMRDVGPMGMAQLPPMPPNSALVRQARGLANLAEDEFLKVVNGVIPERYGALVGAATADGKLQAAMIDVLRRTNPANEVQARSIVDQVRTAGVETKVTEDLFGAQQVTESLYLERAQVLDAALKEARKDKAVFGRLLADEGRITEAGENILDRAANFERLQEANDATAKISRLANTKGPVSEALTEAARGLKAGKKASEVAEAFLESVRRTLIEGDRGGGQAGRARPGREAGGEAGVETGGFDFTPSTRLNLAEQVVEADFIAKLESTPFEDLRTQYAALEEAGGGQILSVDAARELSPDYLRDRTLAPAVQEPASAFIKRLYAARLAEPLKPDERAEVMFTAGGTGAGKTSGLRFATDLDSTQIIMDGNLAKLPSAISKINQALAAGKTVDINYVFREPIEALVNGSIPRAMKQFERFGTGRTVPMEVHAGTFAGARKTILALAEHYADDGRVRITIIDNTNGKGNAALGKIDNIPEIDENSIIKEGLRLIDEAEADGTITKEIAEGFRGRARSEVEADIPAVRGLDQPSSQAAAASPAVDAAPRSIVRALDDSPTPAPDATRTGTVPDTEYDAMMAKAQELMDDEGAFATVSREINGEVETRTLRAELESLDALEDTIERVRICAATQRVA